MTARETAASKTASLGSASPSPSPNSGSAPRPLYLDGSGKPVFAFLHPGAELGKRTAVLMCPPFGWEDMCCYRVRRDWAQGLAQDGYTTLRIDLPGSGDSAGAPGDPGQLDAWTEAVTEAALWLAHSSGADQVAAIGIGLGGLVACRAALGGAAIDGLALWAVPAKGKTLLRELKAFSAFEVANNPDEADERGGAGRSAEGGVGTEDGGAEDGWLTTNGYSMSAETVAELRSLDLARMAPAPADGPATETPARPPATRPRRALVLGRDGLKVKHDLVEALEQAGAEVEVADGQGYGAMMVEPQDARTPVEVIERVGAWLGEGDASSGDGADADGLTAAASMSHSRVPRAREQNDRGLCAPGPDAREPDEQELVTREEMVIEWAGAEIRERPVLLDGPDGPMFGILSEPVGERGEVTAVLLNAGPQRRVGPNRMWVEIARRWAAKGVPALRLDCSGIGDSDGDPTVLARVTEFYRPTYAEQAKAAVQALAERGLGGRFVMVGLCAGSYWSVQTALADERVARVVMLNPRTLVFDEWRHAKRRTRQLGEKALRAETWRKVLTGEIKLSKHLETGRTLVGRAASAPARVLAPGSENGSASAPVGREDPIEALFDALSERGQRGLLLFTGKEVLRGELTERGVLERMERWPNLELVIGGTSADTHTLTPVWLQRQVHELLDRVLEDELGRCTTTS
jgi:pimeloyl-ACP methyl ester carboxylesterase